MKILILLILIIESGAWTLSGYYSTVSTWYPSMTGYSSSSSTGNTTTQSSNLVGITTGTRSATRSATTKSLTTTSISSSTSLHTIQSGGSQIVGIVISYSPGKIARINKLLNK